MYRTINGNMLSLKIVAGMCLGIGLALALWRWFYATPFVRFNLITGLLHIISVTTMVFIDQSDWKSTITLFESELNCEDRCTVTPSVQELEPFPLIYPIVFSGLISGMFHISTANDEALVTGINPTRWIDYAFSSALMVLVIGMLFGVVDLFILLGTSLMQCALMLFTMLMEKNEELATYTNFAPSVFFYIFGVWAPIITTFYTNKGQQPGFVAGIVWGIFVIFALFGVVFWVFKVQKWIENNRYYEFSYMGLSLCAKTALTWTFYGGMSALGRTSQFSMVGGAFGGAVCAGILLTVIGSTFIQPRKTVKQSVY